MYKWVYDRMVDEYKKESKEDLIQRIMALEEIECRDRCFANQCQAGTAIYNINELFSALDDLQFEFSSVKAEKIYGLAQSARNDWDYIRHGLSKINDNFRCSKELENFKNRVKNAKGKMDTI